MSAWARWHHEAGALKQGSTELWRSPEHRKPKKIGPIKAMQGRRYRLLRHRHAAEVHLRPRQIRARRVTGVSVRTNARSGAVKNAQMALLPTQALLADGRRKE